MATATPELFQNRERTPNNSESQVSRQEVEAAIAKTMQLRALHAALVQGNNNYKNKNKNKKTRFPSPSPVSLSVSAQDYPVFTPSYEDEPISRYQPILAKSRTLTESMNGMGIEQGSTYETVFSDFNEEHSSLSSSSLRKGVQVPSALFTFGSHICPVEDQISVASSCKNITLQVASPGTELFKLSGRSNINSDTNSVSSCNRCKPATITTESSRNAKNSNIVVPLTDSQASTQPQTRNHGVISRLFPKLKKKHKNETSPSLAESEETSQFFKDIGMSSVEALKRELVEANEKKYAALMEVSEMKSSLGELRQRLEFLESYCEELRRALRQATSQTNNSTDHHKIEINGIPVSEEAMVEGFLQIASEARLSVKRFCKTLVSQMEESDSTLVDNLNLLLQPHMLSLNSKYTKAVLHHVEAIINQTLYQDFENCAFQKNGSPKHLDPQQDRQARFASFVSLRNLSWNEVLRKGTKYYCEEFSKFCDEKMSCTITTLNWTRPWPGQQLQAFFVAAKSIWLLHLLTFSFNPSLQMLRVEENRSFDSNYMEDIFLDRQRSHVPSRVKIMVVPGFYVVDRVLRCKVICRHKSAAEVAK